MNRPPDSISIIGKPALSYVFMQRFYTERADTHNPVFRADKAWFAAHHYKMTRTLRAAKSGEFDHVEGSFDLNGTRLIAPPLFVSVENRFDHHVVQPVFRGSCFWQQDNNGYLSIDAIDEESDDLGNTRVNSLLLKMHEMGGINPVEFKEYTTRIQQILIASAKSDGQVH